jgi:hypothetical protein
LRIIVDEAVGNRSALVPVQTGLPELAEILKDFWPIESTESCKSFGSPESITSHICSPKNALGQSPEFGRQILQRFRSLSDEITDGSAKRLFYGDVSRGLVRLYLRDAHAAFRESGIRGLARKADRVRARHLKRLAHRVTE